MLSYAFSLKKKKKKKERKIKGVIYDLDIQPICTNLFLVVIDIGRNVVNCFCCMHRKMIKQAFVRENNEKKDEVEVK